jgi:CDGSH-type Zn-finger protein
MATDKKGITASITIAKNGPYIVKGGVPLQKELEVPDREGIPCRWETAGKYPAGETYALCRCGKSGKMPFCDGAHAKSGFDGTETAPMEKFMDKAEIIKGPGMDMADNEKLCSTGLFCHRAGDAWTLVEKSADPEAKKTAVQEACDCPSGRLVALDKKTGEPVEPAFEPSIGVIEDPFRKNSGPFWVKGGIPVISASGKTYEIRNRVTLCRCGESKNKPFCDGTHCEIKFNDGDDSVK